MSRRNLSGITVAALAMVFVGMAPVAAQAETAPHILKNGKELKIEGTELQSEHVPVIAWGHIVLDSPVVGEVKCENTFFAAGWNGYENAEKTTIRGYGEVLGWGTNSCTATTYGESLEHGHEAEITSGKIECYEHPEPVGDGKCLTVFATAEPHLFNHIQEGIVCKEESKKELSQCPSETERITLESLIRRTTRRVASLPWKVEYLEGASSNEGYQRTGLAEYNEAGRHESASKRNNKCFPAGRKFTEVPKGCILISLVFPQIPTEIEFFGTLEIKAHNGSKNGLHPSYIAFEGEATGKLESENGEQGEGTTTGTVTILGAQGEELLTASP